MSLFEKKVQSEYLCPRCGQARMVAVSRPVNVLMLRCECCESELSVEYVQGWHDARNFYAAQPSVQVDLPTVCENCGGWVKGGECENCSSPIKASR